MDILVEAIQWIVFGPDLLSGATQAVLGPGTLGAVNTFFTGRAIKRGLESEGPEPPEAEGQLENTRSRFSDFLNSITSRGEARLDEPRLTADDLFGGIIQRLQDRAASSANATKRALSRGSLARGGDQTGRTASGLLRVDENLADTQGRIGSRFAGLTEQINQQRRGRGAQLLSQGLQGTQNLMSFDFRRLRDELLRRAQREQASKQRTANILGNVLQAGTTVASAMICWVAEELYGPDDDRTRQVRSHLIRASATDEEVAAFLEDYRAYGQTWARIIREDPEARKRTRIIFDRILTRSKAA